MYAVHGRPCREKFKTELKQPNCGHPLTLRGIKRRIKLTENLDKVLKTEKNLRVDTLLVLQGKSLADDYNAVVAPLFMRFAF